MGTGFVSEKHPEELFDACIEEACKRYGIGICSGFCPRLGRIAVGRDRIVRRFYFSCAGIGSCR